ncbi:MAG: phosphatidylglycerophosphatase A [Melioribacteraceae bacterium]|nr:phosphatidylglycerophosphatase A [Melioribacteraceae bacterium]
MKINAIERFIGSGFFTGYIPIAPGTFGSLAALSIYLIPGMENPTILLVLISLFSVVGIPIGTKFETLYGKDPKQCTIDEMVGMWITLLFIPKKIWFIILAFIIWRILDIVKPFPANIAEKLKGGLGIMLDDIIAGIYALSISHIIISIII